MATSVEHLPSSESEYELVLLGHTSGSANSWNAQQIRSDGHIYQPSDLIAQSFDAWIEKLWEQNGDGRKIASSIQVHMAVLAVLSQHSFESLCNSSGLSAVLARCLMQGSGLPVFEEACLAAVRTSQKAGEFSSMPFALMPSEFEALVCIDQTHQLLDQRGLIVQGDVLSFLARHKDEVFLQPIRVRFIDDMPSTPQQDWFFEACKDTCQLTQESAHDQGVSKPLRPLVGIDVELALSSGAYAQSQMLLHMVFDMLRDYPDSHIVITSAHPKNLFESIGLALARCEISCALQATTTLAATDMGRIYALVKLLDTNRIPFDVAALSDLLLSPLCGLNKEIVWQFNKKARGNRLITGNEAVALIQDKSELLRSMLEGDFSKEVFEARFRQLIDQGVSPFYIHEQQVAYYALKEVLDEAQRFGITQEAALQTLIDNIALPSSYSYEDCSSRTQHLGSHEMQTPKFEEAPGQVPQVRIMSQQAACMLAAESVDLLILCDLTTESYPLQEEHDAAQTLLRTLGIQELDTVLAQERALFKTLLGISSKRLILERSLHDDKADPLYPSAMLEELIAAYEEQGIPLQATYKKGEENLIQDIRPLYPTQSMLTQNVSVQEASIAVSHRDLIAPHNARQAYAALPRLSPSQLDLYLECPYKWFVMSRLGAEVLDEDLGPAQKGSFLHTVFQRFYAQFGRKVTQENLSAARRMMFGAQGTDGIFAEVIQEQYAFDENGHQLRNRFVPHPHSAEMSEFDYLKDRVDDWLVFETTFLPHYHPIALEQRFEGISFEGCEIAGVIDRIDTDDEGHLVIIDYKGALKPAQSAVYDDAFREDGKIQALLYTLLIDQLDQIPGSTDDVVGALYVSYNKNNKVVGAYKAGHLGVSQIPSIDYVDACALFDDSELSFSHLLDFTAGRIARAVEGIKNGHIAPAPHGSDACLYCPVLTCDMRGA